MNDDVVVGSAGCGKMGNPLAVDIGAILVGELLDAKAKPATVTAVVASTLGWPNKLPTIAGLPTSELLLVIGVLVPKHGNKGVELTAVFLCAMSPKVNVELVEVAVVVAA